MKSNELGRRKLKGYRFPGSRRSINQYRSFNSTGQRSHMQQGAQQRHESPAVTITWHTRYINSTGGKSSGRSMQKYILILKEKTCGSPGFILSIWVFVIVSSVRKCGKGFSKGGWLVSLFFNVQSGVLVIIRSSYPMKISNTGQKSKWMEFSKSTMSRERMNGNSSILLRDVGCYLWRFSSWRCPW